MTIESICLKNGRIIDPANGRDEIGDLLIVQGKCSTPAPAASLPSGTRVIDATGTWVMPGLIDMHVHLRDPGEEYKETIQSGALAAAAGGFTAVACMPNTKPVIDSEDIVARIVEKARKACVRVYPVGAISKGCKGEALAEFGEMKEAGAVAFTDDGLPVTNSQLMRRALQYASNYDLVIISHSEEVSLSENGAMNEGVWSTRLGLRGIPVAAEAVAVYRDLSLAMSTGCPVHLAHISTKESVDLIRRAKADGCQVTAETAPHYYSLTEEAVGQYNTYAKMNPPLRTQSDLDAIRGALADGTIEVIATDHAPHSDMEKILEFDKAANGIIGLETSLPLTLALVREKVIDASKMVEVMSVNPARILGVAGGSLAEGAIADVTVVDPERQFTYERESVVSKSKNSPFFGKQLTGKAVMTIVGGKVVFDQMGDGG